ncbi:MAG: NFACT RNA binding domain-containing protein, partial [Eubacteriales bacterium]|nr:NFACT RNA binding domain-containing protein [Eubacteriales bacterium]
MAFDGFFCAAIAKELKASLMNARIEKINCRGSSAEFSLYGERTKKYLFVSLMASANFITVRDTPTLPNDIPSSFCLLLRKHLQAGKIKEIEAVENERIIKFVFDSPDELGHISEKTIYAEIMGKYSNLILTSGGRILGGLYSADLVSFKRAVMPGIEYELPPAQEKISAKSLDLEKFVFLCEMSPEKRADRFLIDNFFCFSPLTAWETVYSASGDGDDTVEKVGAEKLYNAVKELYSIIEKGAFVPTAVYNEENAAEFSFADIHRYGNYKKKRFDTLCALTSAFFRDKSGKSLLKERTADLQKLISARIKRIEKKEALQREELEECKNKDKSRLYGELLTANLYRIKQGDEKCVCSDWYSGNDVEIGLDTRLSPSKNAERFFKKYRKYVNAEKAICEQLKESGEEKQYLESVLDCVNRCENAEEAELVRDELANVGYIRKKDKKLQRKPCRPFEYKTSGGFTVRVGRNNIMNDTLTKSAEKNDIWFHVKHFPGSHVILYTEGREPGDADYTEAACIAAYHSSARGGANVQVDYTRVKYVRKPAGSKPGYVIYDKYFTAVADGTKL